MTTLVRRASLVIVALMTSACALTNTGDPAVAASIDDRTIPAAEVDATVASIRQSESFQQQAVGDTSGNLALDAQTQVVTSYVQSAILNEVAERNDVEVSDVDIAAARDALVEQLGGPEAFEAQIDQQGLTEEFVTEQVLRVQQTQQALQQEIGPDADFAEFLRTELEDIDVEVNPRYGEWSPDNLTVTRFDPLDGVAQAGAAGTEAP